jgi:S-methylmethionine-dependent homocysteine/selenocysteine methylase
VRAGVDLVLVETMNTGREAAIAVEAVRDAGGRAWASFACGAGGRLLSGEPLSEAAGAVEAAGAEAVLVNCTPPAETETALRSLRDATGVPIGAYPNAEARGGPAVGPHELAEALGRWHEELDLRIVGGCCGTTPAHIAAVAARLALSRPRAAAGS